MSIKLKSVISKQIPEFVRDDHPAFVQFLEAYYEFLDQTEKRNLIDIRDLDNTLDAFITNIKAELNIYGESEYPYVDKILFIRKVKEIFTAKGSEAAYKFLFKVLFDKPVSISYPWDSVLKCSDGKWKQDISLFVNVTSGSPTILPGSKVSIIGNSKKVKVYVERYQHVRDNIYEVFIDKNFYGIINIGDIIQINGFVGEIIPTTVSYTIENPGSGYRVGDLLTGTTIANGVTITQLLKVTKVDADGGIKSIVNVTYGCGYTADFFLLTSNTTIIKNSSIRIDRDITEQTQTIFNSTDLTGGSGVVDLPNDPTNSLDLAYTVVQNQFDIPNDSQIEKYTDYGEIINPNYWITETTDNLDTPYAGAESYSESTYAGTFLRQFYTETITGQNNTDYTLIRFNIGAVARYQGHWTTNDGFLSDNIYLQDSKYYQKYSYLVTIDERLQDYKSILLSYLHPAGVALFGEYQMQHAFVTNLSASVEVAEYISKATFATINKQLTDTFVPSGAGGIIRVEPYDLETYFLEDYNPATRTTFTG